MLSHGCIEKYHLPCRWSNRLELLHRPWKEGKLKKLSQTYNPIGIDRRDEKKSKRGIKTGSGAFKGISVSEFSSLFILKAWNLTTPLEKYIINGLTGKLGRQTEEIAKTREKETMRVSQSRRLVTDRIKEPVGWDEAS